MGTFECQFQCPRMNVMDPAEDEVLFEKLGNP